MLAHQRRRMPGARLQCSDYCSALRRIAQCHGNVAQPLFMADAIDRAAREPGIELGFIPREQLNQSRIVQTVAHRKIRLGAGLRKTVPRTD